MTSENPEKELINAKVGERIQLGLPELDSAGYEWQFDYDSDVFSLAQDSFEPADPATGSGGTRQVELLSLKGGTYEVRAELRRPWEQVPEQVRVFQIIVKDAD